MSGKKSGKEYKITDTRGKFSQVIRGGRKLNDAGWTPGRILLSNRRVVLASNDGKRTIPLSSISKLGGRHDASQMVARVSGYVSLRFDDNVILLAAEDHEAFERDLYRALLDQRVVDVKHPAVAGGVVQDTEWEKARLKLGEDSLNVAMKSGSLATVDLDDIGTVETLERTVEGTKQTVVAVEHTEEGTSVQTHLTGEERLCQVLSSLLEKGAQRSQANVELGESENEVLMALYSGVSPFEIPNFLGMDVDEVEEIYERLIELEIVDEVRTRHEVTLNSRGRNIASEAMNEQ